MTSAADGSQRVLKPREALCPTPDKKESGLSASWSGSALNPENMSAQDSSLVLSKPKVELMHTWTEVEP